MIVPLFGHEDLKARLSESARRGTLPASLLFQGSRGVGKQRLALWLGQLLLCEGAAPPCGNCRHCRFVQMLTHPDVHWYFPRPRLKDADPELEDVKEDYAEAIAERAEANGLYSPPPGSEGIYVATVRAIVQQAALSPSISKRKIFIIGDAERMVPQEGSEQAANAFLKLLEEPPADTTIVLTSSEPGALLPTIRSRVVAIRVPGVADEHVRAFVSQPDVAEKLAGDAAVPRSDQERVAFASGAPGRLLAGSEWAGALDNARRMLDAANGKPGEGYEAAWGQAASKARGSFASTLDALSVLLHARIETAVARGNDRSAAGASRAIEAVEVAKERVDGNVSPQLITANLIRELEVYLS
jgi:DNA polymerase III subunit delta'